MSERTPTDPAPNASALAPGLEAEVDPGAIPNFKQRRRAVETWVIDEVMLTLDPSGLNSKRYQDEFARMSDAMFLEWIKGMRDGTVRLKVYAPNMKNNLRMHNVLALIRLVGVAVFEKLRIWDSVARRFFITPHRYLVLQLPVRRLKQTLKDKISVPESDTTTDLFTGQVVKPDKGSSISLVEMQTMFSKGLEHTIVECMNVRGGNVNAYAALKASLEETGQASLNDLGIQGGPRSVNVAQTYLEGMMLENNLAG